MILPSFCLVRPHHSRGLEYFTSMTPPTRRAFQITLALGVLLVYAAVAMEISQSNFSLVNDYMDMTLIRGGWWPKGIVSELWDFSSASAWVYRPFADALSWIFAVRLEQHVGAWHAILIGIRLISAALVYGVARTVSESEVAACVAAAYFAFFPAISEINLTRVETYAILMLALAYYGFCRDAPGVTAAAFIGATASKEVLAPILIAFLAFAAPMFWRRGVWGRLALIAMSIAALNQTAHFVLLVHVPYAMQRPGNLVAQTWWTMKTLSLATTNWPLVPLLLAVWIIWGAVAFFRKRDSLSMMTITLLILSLAMACKAPYPALRYLSPAALFMVPLLAAGIDQSRKKAQSITDSLAFVTLVSLIVFGGAVLCAQAASMRNSTNEDWRLLQMAARALASGRDVVMQEDADFERAFWVRAELVGVDPRFSFVGYVSSRTSQGLPVQWPEPPIPAVNLTRLVLKNSPGRFSMARRLAGAGKNVLFIPPNPEVRTVRDDDDPLTRGAATFEHFAKKLNPKFHYPFDLGEAPFPGTKWP